MSARIVTMVSTLVSRLSALALFLGGFTLLFAPDAVLPRFVPGFPAGGARLGQLLAAAWLGVAALDVMTIAAWWLRWRTRAREAGHALTLEPRASGLERAG